MSEDTNEFQSDDALMENSEFEVSEEIEVTIEMQRTHTPIESSEFEAKLTEFFTKHKPTKLRFVSRIAFEFKGQESFVMEHLHNKYVLGIAAEKPVKHTAPKSTDHGHGEKPKNIEASDSVKPKSSKKLVIIVIVVVVLGGLGVTGFLMKDKLMAMGGHKTEKAVENAKTEVESKAIDAPAKSEVIPAAAANDSTKTAVSDTAKTK